MKYKEMKKVHTKLASNRYIYYEPNLEPKQQPIENNNLVFGLVSRLLVCGFIFVLLLVFAKIPVLENISSAVKNAVSYNSKIFHIEEPGTIPIIQKINFIADTTPLQFDTPLQTQNITYDGHNARLALDQNPLVYSSEKGIVSNISKTNDIITIEIKHKNNTITKYTGIKFSGVQKGQAVDKGYPIGVLAGDQLIFGIYEDGKQTSLADKVQWV